MITTVYYKWKCQTVFIHSKKHKKLKDLAGSCRLSFICIPNKMQSHGTESLGTVFDLPMKQLFTNRARAISEGDLTTVWYFCNNTVYEIYIHIELIFLLSFYTLPVEFVNLFVVNDHKNVQVSSVGIFFTCLHNTLQMLWWEVNCMIFFSLSGKHPSQCCGWCSSREQCQSHS